MFTDVVGYTALTERDVEAARTVRLRHRSVLEQNVAKHGGDVVQFLGDGGGRCLSERGAGGSRRRGDSERSPDR
jgi:class 3 adenylate cyclase